jgi:hypothetical protein
MKIKVVVFALDCPVRSTQKARDSSLCEDDIVTDRSSSFPTEYNSLRWTSFYYMHESHTKAFTNSGYLTAFRSGNLAECRFLVNDFNSPLKQPPPRQSTKTLFKDSIMFYAYTQMSMKTMNLVYFYHPYYLVIMFRRKNRMVFAKILIFYQKRSIVNSMNNILSLLLIYHLLLTKKGLDTRKSNVS